jgi:hypothetical protein
VSIGCAAAVQVAEEQPAEEGNLDERFPCQRNLPMLHAVRFYIIVQGGQEGMGVF